MSNGQIGQITSEEWGWIFLVGFLSILAFWGQMASLQLIAASTLGSLQALEVLFAYFVQIVVMNQSASILSLIGSAIVMISVTAISVTDKLVDLFTQKNSKSMGILSEEPIDVENSTKF